MFGIEFGLEKYKNYHTCIRSYVELHTTNPADVM
jgi:hypothetical protein